MPVELRPVTGENWRALAKLEVGESQRGFVAANVFSIAESQFGHDDEDGHWDFYPFGIYAQDEPVGFMMYVLNLTYPRYQAFIARLMVDEKSQGRGHGRRAMELTLNLLRGDGRIRHVGISYEPHNQVARKLYLSFGFVEPGEMVGEETLAIITL